MPSTTRRTHYWLTFAVLAVAVSSYTLMQSLTIPVLSEIEQTLHTDQNTVTWVLTAYLLSASVFTPIMGRLGDALGKERVLVFSLVALAAGSLLAALATSIGVLIIARVIQGVGGGVLPLAFGIIRDEFPHHKVGGAVSVVSSLLAVGVRRRHRAGRSDRVGPGLPLAVLGTVHRDLGRRRCRSGLRPRVAGPYARPHLGAPRRPALRLAGGLAARLERSAQMGMGRRAHGRPARAGRCARGRAGSRSSSALPCR